MKQPCERDCPDRAAGCGANCEKWQRYVKERNENYEERVQHWKDEEIIFDGKTRSIRKNFSRRRK